MREYAGVEGLIVRRDRKLLLLIPCEVMPRHSLTLLPKRREARVLCWIFIFLFSLDAQRGSCYSHGDCEDWIDEPRVCLDVVCVAGEKLYLLISHG